MPATETDRVDTIARGLALYLVPGQVSELRAIGVGTAKARCAYFADPHEMALAALTLEDQGARGIYFTPNPLRPEILNEGRGPNKGATKEDVLRRAWLLVDADPGQPAKTNATDAEKAAAFAVLQRAVQVMQAAGFVGRIVADSSNGYHAAYPIDLPNDDTATLMVKQVLHGLHLRCSDAVDAGPHIDVTVHDAPRIWKVPGVISRKGPHTEERPCRRSGILWDLCELHTANTVEANTLAMRRLVEDWGQQCADLDAIEATWIFREVREASAVERAAAYLEKMRPAISGQHGSDVCYRAAAVCVESFALSDDEALDAMAAWNARCVPPWSEKELRHKLASARAKIDPARLGAFLRGESSNGATANGHANGHVANGTPAANGKTKPPLPSATFRDPVPASQLVIPAGQPWIWNGLLARGSITLMSALWKAGKTTLLTHMLKGLETGGQFCGRKLEMGRALVITEEGEGRWARRRDLIGLKDHVEFMVQPFRAKPSWEQWLAFLAHVEKMNAARNYDLILMDTLVNLWPVKDENDASQVQGALMPLRQLGNNPAVQLVHHTRKGDGQEAVASRGSGALTAFVDTIMELRRYDARDRHDRRRVISAYGRDEETPAEMVIELTGADGYRLIEGGRQAENARELGDVIAELLPTEPPGMSFDEIVEAWPGDTSPRKTTLLMNLRTGAEQGKWAMTGEGVKGDPRRYWRMPPPE